MLSAHSRVQSFFASPAAADASIPSLAFVHIPPKPFAAAQDALGRHSLLGGAATHFPGLNANAPAVVQSGDGTHAEDGAFTTALRIMGAQGLHSVYSGHDHGDAWCTTWDGRSPGGESAGEAASSESDEATPVSGEPPASSSSAVPFTKSTPPKSRGPFAKSAHSQGPHLCFCKHTGYGGYGDWRRGARIVRVTLPEHDGGEMAVESWVRMEGGRVVTRVGLNATYGLDVYPAETGEE
jgi:hypothetical protein